jgi:hypothetical protein
VSVQAGRSLPGKNGFIAVLEKLTVAVVTAVKGHGITGEQPTHQRGKGNTGCAY